MLKSVFETKTKKVHLFYVYCNKSKFYPILDTCEYFIKHLKSFFTHWIKHFCTKVTCQGHLKKVLLTQCKTKIVRRTVKHKAKLIQSLCFATVVCYSIAPGLVQCRNWARSLTHNEYPLKFSLKNRTLILRLINPNYY